MNMEHDGRDDAPADKVAADMGIVWTLTPNAITTEAIEAARRGEVVVLGTPADAVAELNRDD